MPTFAQDKKTLEDVRIAYAQSGLGPQENKPLPRTPDDMRMAELGTAYTAIVVGRPVIMIPAKGNWFRENWVLAHELAHLVGRETEDAANAFAAELLLLEVLVRRIAWTSVSQQTVADFLWETGDSAQALHHRLDALKLSNTSTETLLDCSTQRLLRGAPSWSQVFGDQITERMNAAAVRRFPLALQEAHEQKVEAGQPGPGYLAWMRGVSEVWLTDEYESSDSGSSVDELATEMGLEIA